MKRELDKGEPSKGGKKSRRSCSDAITCLRMKADIDYLFKKEGLEQKKNREKEAQEIKDRERERLATISEGSIDQQQQQDMLQ